MKHDIPHRMSRAQTANFATAKFSVARLNLPQLHDLTRFESTVPV